MINNFRQIFLFSAVIFVFAKVLSASADYQMLDQVVAVVEDDVVLASEVRDRLGLLQQTLNKRGVPLPSVEELFNQVVEQSILESLQLQRAASLGVRVSDQELSNALTGIAGRNGMSLSEFRQMLLAEGESYVELRENIRKELLLNQVQQRHVFRNINISKAEIESFLDSERGRALVQPEWQIDHLLLEVNSFSDSTEVASKKQAIENLREKAIQAGSFQSILPDVRNAGVQYAPLGWVKAETMPSMFSDVVKKLNNGDVAPVIESESGFHLIRIADIRGGAVGAIKEVLVSHILVSETAIRDEEKSKKLIEDVRERAADGESFALLARTYSEDPGTALSGGNLGWTGYGRMVPEFDAMMEQTNKGEISSVFRSQFGWHILTVLDKREKDGFKEYSHEIAQRAIVETKYDDALQNWLQELRDNAYVDIK